MPMKICPWCSHAHLQPLEACKACQQLVDMLPYQPPEMRDWLIHQLHTRRCQLEDTVYQKEFQQDLEVINTPQYSNGTVLLRGLDKSNNPSNVNEDNNLRSGEAVNN